MTTDTYPDAIDTRIVFKVYALVTAITGALLVSFPRLVGPLQATGTIDDPRWLKASIVRVVGAVLLAAACSAMALAGIEEPRTRHRGLFWFALGHTVLLLVCVMQATSVWDVPPIAGQIALGCLVAPVLIFVYFWNTGDGHRSGQWAIPTTLFGRSRQPIEQLRSQYEEQIREAAGQEERNRLARELHDSIKQQIFVIQTAAATAGVRFGSDEAGARQAIEQVRSSARDAMTELEVMLDQLRAAPLENVGLVEALKKQCEALAFRTGANVEFKPSAIPPADMLPPRAPQVVLRVAQEALANVARHARAKDVRVTLGTIETGALQLKIEDDGQGFDPAHASQGMGLSNMRARAEDVGGVLTVGSDKTGTTVVLSVPTLQPADWGNYRRRVVAWSVASLWFLGMVIWDVVSPHPGALVVNVPIFLLNLIVLGRTVVVYRRVRTRKVAARWEESTTHDRPGW